MSAALPPVLVEQIEREHDAALGAARASLKHAAACGRLLLEAKASVPHGQWLPWIEANLSILCQAGAEIHAPRPSVRDQASKYALQFAFDH